MAFILTIMVLTMKELLLEINQMEQEKFQKMDKRLLMENLLLLMDNTFLKQDLREIKQDKFINDYLNILLLKNKNYKLKKN